VTGDLVWAVTMVRNEQDVIVPVTRHLLAEGIDHVLIADNLSTDRTRELVEELASEGSVTIIDDPDPAYSQAAKMTQLAQRAGAAGAAWIIPFDADELWLSTSHPTLRHHLESLRGVDVVAGDWYQHYAPLLPRRDPFVAMAWRDAQPDDLTKVAFRFRPDIALTMGNHSVRSELPVRSIHDPHLEVHHYRYRTFGQMIAKSRHGKKAIELADPRPEICIHWRLHGGRTKVRLAVTWIRMALRRRGRLYDLRRPRVDVPRAPQP
jgi:glycosyltransferase involved in cell wall biosynthesis